MLSDRRGEVSAQNLLLLAFFVLMSAATAYFIINLSVQKVIFLFATGLLCILSFVNVSIGLFFIVFFMMFPNLMPRQMFGIVGINPFNLLFGAIITVVILRMIVRGSDLRFAEPFYIPLVLIFLLQGIALLRFQDVSHVPLLENTHWLTRFLKPMQYVILLILIINFIRSKQIPLLSIIILSGLLVAGGILFAEWLSHGFAMTTSFSVNRTHLLWANPVLGHKVNWGTMFTLSFFFVLAISGQRFHHWNFVLRLLSWIALGLIGFAIAVSLARVAYVCLVVGILYFFWKRGRFQLMVMLIILAIAISIMPEMVRLRASQDLPTVWNAVALDRLLSGRLSAIWIPAVQSFLESPLFGKGFNGAGVYLLGQAHFVFPHSGYIATLCDMGIVGLVVMIWLFVSLWRYCGRIYLNTKSQLTRRLSLGCRAQILILALSNLTSDHSFFYNPTVVAPFFPSVAMLFALYRQEQESQKVAPPVLHEEEILVSPPV